MICSFEPIASKDAKVLILGSMPGGESLRRQQYYAQKTNVFWRIMFDLFHESFSEEYEVRTQLILNHQLALWDVLSTCEREGSLDSNIKNEQANDLAAFLVAHPSIDRVCFNGKKAYDSYKRWIGFDKTPGIRFLRMPSTSAAHAVRYEVKLNAWREGIL